MSPRTALFAVAALAALATALAPTSASALDPQNTKNGPNAKMPKKPFGPDQVNVLPKKPAGPQKLVGVDPITFTPKKPPVAKPLIGADPKTWSPKKPLIGNDPNTWSPTASNWRHRHRDHWRWYARSWHYDAEPVITTRVVATPPAERARVNCLTKEYLPDGSALFKDICTNEAAIATPEQLRAQAMGLVAPAH